MRRERLELQIEFCFMSLEVHLKMDLVLSECPLLGFQNAGGHVCQILVPVASRPTVLRHASCPPMCWLCFSTLKKWTNKSYRAVHVKRHTERSNLFPNHATVRRLLTFNL